MKPVGQSADSQPAAMRATVVRKRWRAKLGKLTAGSLVGLALGELLVLLVAGEQPKFPRHVVKAPWGLRYNHPGAVYRHQSADMTASFRINRQGMRSDRDFEYRKPAGMQRILSLGDSFTIGYEVDVDQCFSSILESELRQAGLNVEVLNAGVSGFSNAEELLYLERELIKYAPDLVVVSFYGNDIADNLRSGLFRLQAGRLVAQNTEYVPGGKLASFLNTSWLFNLLSERSNSFALAKETLTVWIKSSEVDKRLESIRREEGTDAIDDTASPGTAPEDVPGILLTAAIFERLYDFLQARDIPLVIQSIPAPAQALAPGARSGPHKLAELFPLANFDVRRPRLHFVSGKEFLEASRTSHLLYWTRSHLHWTPFSHAASGRHLAQVILREKLIE